MTVSLTKRLTLSGAASLLALTLATAASAQTKPKAEAAPPACPPGAFCEETPVGPPPTDDGGEEGGEAPEEGAGEEGASEEGASEEGASEEGASEEGASEEGAPTEEGSAATEKSAPVTVVLPPTDNPNKPRTFTYHPDPDGGPGQVIIYEDGDAPPHFVGKKTIRKKVRRRRRIRKHRRWGLNLRVDGVILPQYRENQVNETGMAGLGVSLRYRPTPMFALDFGADFMGGIDSNGFERQEIPLAVSAMLYVNPRSVVQFYMFGGIDWSFARVYSQEVEVNLAQGNQDEYTYFGGHAGVGLEFRVSKLVGINVDGLAFVRSRTDDDGNGAYPEFYNPNTHEASNSSAAGLLRAGLTFWW